MMMQRSFFLGFPLLVVTGTAAAAPPALSSGGGPSELGADGSAAAFYDARGGRETGPTGDFSTGAGTAQRPQDTTYGPARGPGSAADGGPRRGNDIYGDGLAEGDGTWSNATPDYHVVADGDTLWGICGDYFRDPYMWPQVWSWNDQVTNAHWIFPGDRVRLKNPIQEPSRIADTFADIDQVYEARVPKGKDYLLNRYAFVDAEEFERSMEVVGGSQSKVMMSTLDTAYIRYEPESPPVAGERLSVYRPQQEIYDIEFKGRKRRQRKGKKIGYLVEVVGEVEIERVAKKTAEATVADSVRPVERGMRVGELKTRFVRVAPVDAETTDNGLVVETIRDLALSGEENIVVVNMGSNRKIRRGNILDVVRKGDEYSPSHRFISPYESGHPRRVVGHILVLQVQPDAAMGVVLDSRREVLRGDHVEIRGPKAGETDQPAMRKAGRHLSADAHAEIVGDGGNVEGSAGFRVGQ